MRSKTDLEPANYSNTPCKQIQPLSRIKTLRYGQIYKAMAYLVHQFKYTCDV